MKKKISISVASEVLSAVAKKISRFTDRYGSNVNDTKQ